MTKSKSFILMLLGSFLAAAGISNFYLPNKIVTGGAGGLATLFYYLLKIPAGASIMGLSVLFLIVGFKVLGKDFVIKSIIGTAVISVMTEITALFGSVTDNAALSAIFGALLYGVGAGLVFISGYNTGGTDIIGRIVQYRFPHLSIGYLLTIINGIIILSSLKLFSDVNLTLLGILSLIISNITVDCVVSFFNNTRMVFIISKDGGAVTQMVLESFGRGVTVLNGTGGFTGEEKAVMLCAISGKQLDEVKEKVLEIDDSAFVVFVDTRAVAGKGFYTYK